MPLDSCPFKRRQLILAIHVLWVSIDVGQVQKKFDDSIVAPGQPRADRSTDYAVGATPAGSGTTAVGVLERREQGLPRVQIF